MNYPYPDLLPLLQLELDVPTYEGLTHPLFSSPDAYRIRLDWAKRTPYWRSMPMFTYAVCPLCHGGYSAQLDPYTLWGWSAGGVFRNVPYGLDLSSFQSCTHFLGVHTFIHLHDHVPENTFYSTRSGEVPFISPHLFPDDMDTRAVLSALPICRIVEQQFVPTYTAWWITYFTEQPKTLTQRHYQRERELYGHDPEYYPSILVQPFSRTQTPDETPFMSYGLARWCAEGKLGWLDFTQPDLPLKIGAGLVLPAVYTDIHGDRRCYTYRKERIKELM